MQIRPVSDLRNKFTEIESVVREGSPVYLTKNGYGSMVVLSIEAYERLTNQVEYALDYADYVAEHDSTRLSHEDVFGKVRANLNAE
ncbi:MAG: type II toxin-antitoxin system Phd/YefM family antitoxin [Firmicutes bacterium]|nr:type II toxin-antitoxin system Phd/YefM family antitoxin [Bacillota bacterium]